MRNIFLLAFLLVQVAFADGGFVHHGLHANSCPEGQYALSITARGLLGCGEPSGGGGGSGDVVGPASSPNNPGYAFPLALMADSTGKLLKSYSDVWYWEDGTLQVKNLTLGGGGGIVSMTGTGILKFTGYGNYFIKDAINDPDASLANLGVLAANGNHYPFLKGSMQSLHLGYDAGDASASVSAGVVKVKPGVDFGVTSDKFTVSGATATSQYSSTAAQVKMRSDSGGKKAALEFVDLSGTTPTVGLCVDTTPGFYEQRIFGCRNGTTNDNIYIDSLNTRVHSLNVSLTNVNGIGDAKVFSVYDSNGGAIETINNFGMYPATPDNAVIGGYHESGNLKYNAFKFGVFNHLWLGSTSGTIPAAVNGSISAPTGTAISLNTTDEGVSMKTSGSKPTCNSTHRNQFFITQGGAGVADVLEVCMKDAADAYAWVTK